MGKKMNFVLTPANQAMLNTYKSYVPHGFRFSMSELVNELLATYLTQRVSEMESESNN